MTGPREHIVRVFRNADELSRAAAEGITRRADRTVRERGRFTIALSGGSTPKILYSLLASSDSPYRERMPWGDTHFFFGDERHVPPDHPESNYRMAHEAMLVKVPVPTENVHRVKTEKPDASEAASDYEHVLREFVDHDEGAAPRFDLVLLGMGTDGHTASLFPGTAALTEKSRFFVANRVAKFDAHRLTMTLPVINNAAVVMFLVAGSDKADVLQRVLEKRRDRQNELFPAQLVRPLNGEVSWLIDGAAATHLHLEG